MNRKIKFRAWDPDDKEMYEPMVLAVVDNASLSLSPLRKCKDGNRVYKPQHPLMQFTGLKDKNGVDIYEGDILQDSEGNRYVILWDSGDARFVSVNMPDYILNPEYRFDEETLIWAICKVIGNIHSNPELIK